MYVRITFIFFALFVPLFALNIRHGTRDTVQAHKLTLKQDFLYLETGHVTINPDFVSVIRPFNFDNIISLHDQLLTLTVRHDDVCDMIEAHYDPDVLFIKAAGYRTFRDEAIRICERLHMHLPEVRNVTDAQALARTLLRYGDSSCHSGPTFNAFLTAILFPDGENVKGAATTLCDQPNGSFDVPGFYRDYYGALNKSRTELPHRYQVNAAHSIDLCVGHRRPYHVYCQVPKAFSSRIREQLHLCRRHTQDMETAHASLTSSQNVLIQSIKVPFLPTNDHSSPFEPPNALPSSHKYVHFNVTKMKSTLKRGKREAFMFIVSIFSIIASVLSLLATQATPAHTNSTYESLMINTHDTSTKLDNLNRDYVLNFNSLRSFSSHVMTSMSFYDSYLRVLMSLQDNMLSFQSIVQALSYGQVTSEILSTRDIKFLERKLNIGGDTSLSYKPQDLIVRPVIYANTLSIQVDIPVIQHSKQATLFEVRPYPVFYNNIKYIVDCPIRHFAVYEHSSHFQTLTDDEYNSCLNINRPCLSRTPRVSSIYGNCASNQFFDINDSYLKHVPAPDNAPFLFTYHNETYFSVGSDTPLTFHCSENVRPGPDHELLLQGRGSFINPALCTFQALHMEFAPPKNIYTERYPLTEQFVLPDIVTQPPHTDFEQLSDNDAAIRILNFSNHSLLSATQKWLIALSISLFLLATFLILLYFSLPYYNIFQPSFRYVQSFFSCCDIPPLSSPSPPTSPGSTPRRRFPTLSTPPHASTPVTTRYADDITLTNTRCSESIATVSLSSPGSPHEPNSRPRVVLARPRPQPFSLRATYQAARKPQPPVAPQNPVEEIYARPRVLCPPKGEGNSTGMHDLDAPDTPVMVSSTAMSQNQDE